MIEKVYVVSAHYSSGQPSEVGWECKSEWEANRLVEWLGEQGFRAKAVDKTWFAKD